MRSIVPAIAGAGVAALFAVLTQQPAKAALITVDMSDLPASNGSAPLASNTVLNPTATGSNQITYTGAFNNGIYNTSFGIISPNGAADQFLAVARGNSATLPFTLNNLATSATITLAGTRTLPQPMSVNFDFFNGVTNVGNYSVPVSSNWSVQSFTPSSDFNRIVLSSGLLAGETVRLGVTQIGFNTRETVSVSEPNALGVLGLGLLALAAVRRRRTDVSAHSAPVPHRA